MNYADFLLALGIQHLRDRLIKTPLDPAITLFEDPLRLIRAARLAAKLDNFTIDEELVKAACSDNIRIALENKVKIERVHQEIMKIYASGDPLKLWTILGEWGLIDHILCFHETAEAIGYSDKKSKFRFRKGILSLWGEYYPKFVHQIETLTIDSQDYTHLAACSVHFALLLADYCDFQLEKNDSLALRVAGGLRSSRLRRQ